jgi:hypothetical protein
VSVLSTVFASGGPGVTVTGGGGGVTGVIVFVADGVVVDFEQDASKNTPAIKPVNNVAFIQLLGDLIDKGSYRIVTAFIKII